MPEHLITLSVQRARPRPTNGKTHDGLAVSILVRDCVVETNAPSPSSPHHLENQLWVHCPPPSQLPLLTAKSPEASRHHCPSLTILFRPSGFSWVRCNPGSDATLFWTPTLSWAPTLPWTRQPTELHPSQDQSSSSTHSCSP